MAPSVSNSTHTPKEFVSSHFLARDAFSFGKTQSAICGLLQQTFVAATVVLYSKNFLSAAVGL
jgi:hypothetical protein